MPTLHEIDGPERPPLIKAGSSSSLDGTKQLAPCFQSFIKRTPLILDYQKPLPPPPLMARRASSSSLPRSRSSACLAQRRSSSVYSRTVSQWDSDGISWRSADFTDEPMPAVPFLLPLAYSASTPHLIEKLPAPSVVQARRYTPLIKTPSSTTASEVTTPDLTRDERLTVWPSFVAPAEIPQKHLRTISLEEANAAIHAPGAIHFLPEELRAKRFRRSRSHDALRTPRETPILVDNQGRRRTIVSPKDTFSSSSKFPFPAINIWTNEVPLLTQHHLASKDQVIQTLGLDEFEEPRGRTKHRGPRNVSNAHNFANGKRHKNDTCPERESVAQRTAKEYHAVLSEQYPKRSSAPGYDSLESDEKVKASMKLIPRPLFQTKPPAKLPGHSYLIEGGEISSPYSLSAHTGEHGSPNRPTTDYGEDITSPTLSKTPKTSHNRRSTSGSIPISPPEPTSRSYAVRHVRSSMTKREKVPFPRRKGNNSRASAYYPHVASRKGTKPKISNTLSANGSEMPSMPLLPANFTERKSQAAGYLSSSSPRSASPKTFNSSGEMPGKSDGNPGPLSRQRVIKDLSSLVMQPERYEQTDHHSTTAATACLGAPDVLPSSVNAKPKEIHLGWSDVAKNTFDKLVLPAKSPPKLESPLLTHIAASARPLDESKASLMAIEPPRRKSSIFGGFLDNWKESKAEKRRAELKKIIRCLPYVDGNSGNDSMGSGIVQT